MKEKIKIVLAIVVTVTLIFVAIVFRDERKDTTPPTAVLIREMQERLVDENGRFREEPSWARIAREFPPDQRPQKPIEPQLDPMRNVLITKFEPEIIFEVVAPSGDRVRVLNGDSYVRIDIPEYSYHEQFIQHVGKDGTIKEVLHHVPRHLPSGVATSTLEISPDGNYVSFTVYYYESGKSYLININTGENIFDVYRIQHAKTLWPENEKFVVIHSYFSGMDGSGVNGLFVSEWGKPGLLRKVFDYGEQHYDRQRWFEDAEKIEDIRMESQFVYFTAITNSGVRVRYQYDVRNYNLISY